jgi:hypothetical protein
MYQAILTSTNLDVVYLTELTLITLAQRCADYPEYAVKLLVDGEDVCEDTLSNFLEFICYFIGV